jgi:putative ABC transport system permease protein
MTRFVASNLTHHPGRTLAATAGVGVAVLLVVLTTGLVRGMLRERGRREANTGVELMLSQQGQHGISVVSLPVTMPVEWADAVRQVAGVAAVTPVAQHLEMKGESGLGLRQIDGVEFDSYRRAAALHILDGQPLPDAGAVVLVDFKYAAARSTRVGDTLTLLDREFRVAGIFEPETGARLMIPIATMQELLGAPGKCSMLLVKCQNAGEQEAVAQRIVARFPTLRVVFTRDLPRLFAEGYGALDVFLKVVAALAAAISLLIIMLTMYTTVVERTHQIGILKSLGASKRFIAAVFIEESLAISALGIVGGIAAALLARIALIRAMGATLEIEPGSLLLAGLGGLAGGAAGALIPALRAARLDAIEALNHD